MGALAKLEQQLPLVLDEYYARCRAAESSRQEEQEAAVMFQSAWRGYFLRQQMKHMQCIATTIQRYWRGYVGRQRFAHARDVKDRRLRQAYFDAHATVIQKWWRGCFSRKHIHNFYARKAYLTAVQQQNSYVRANMQQELQATLEQQQHAAAEAAKAQFEAQVGRLGHLMSTANRPGIFSSPYGAAAGVLPVVAGATLEEHLRANSRKQGAALVASARRSPQRHGSPATASPTATAATLPGSTAAGAGGDAQTLLTLRQVAPYEAEKEQKALEARIVRGQMIATHGTPFVSACAPAKLSFIESQSIRGSGSYAGGADAILATMMRKSGQSPCGAHSTGAKPFTAVNKQQPFFDKSIRQGY